MIFGDILRDLAMLTHYFRRASYILLARRTKRSTWVLGPHQYAALGLQEIGLIEGSLLVICG